MDQRQHSAKKANRFFVYPIFLRKQRFAGWASLFCPRGTYRRCKRWAKKSAHPTIIALFALALSGNIYAGDATRHYKIPAQSLNNALMRFAADSNLELVFTADKVRGLTANRLDGTMTAAQALTRLLQGSGMTYRFINAKSVTLEQQPSNFRKTGNVGEKPQPQSNSGETGSETTLEKVTVEADSAYDPEYYADPYNQDYVIPNATAGTKTDTPIMETPLNVQVISKQVLKEQQVIRLDQALKNVSGVTQVSAGNFNNDQQTIFLRGFDAQTYFRNGFRLTQGSANREMANVESVEVLKGPAAILYGLVEPGGMVNVVTKQPLATPYYGFTQQFGSFDTYRSTIDATGPISKNKDLLYRVNMSYENSGSFKEFVGKEDVFFAPVLKWNISPKTQATFELEYNRAHLGLDNGNFIPVLNGKLLNTPRGRNYAEYSGAAREEVFGGFNWSHQFNDDWVIKHRFSANQKSFDSPFLSSTLAAGPLNDFGVVIVGNNVGRTGQSSIAQNNTYSTNLDLTGRFETWGFKHTLLVGGDYYRLSNKEIGGDSTPFDNPSLINIFNPQHPGTPFPLGTPGSGSRTTENIDQYGLYIQDQIKLPYDVHVMGGIRYQYIHQNQLITSPDGTPQDSTIQSQDAVTPRVGILWQPKSWFTLYANYAENFGANTGKTFVRPSVGKIIDPTSATQYEGGIKTEFLDGRLRATLAYYDLTKTNIAVSDPIQSHNCGSGAGNCSVAIGEARSRGPELDITGEILPGWNVIATWSNIDVRVTKASPDPNNSFVSSGLGGANLGDRFANVPRNKGTLWTTYEVQQGTYEGLKFGGGVNLTDRTYTGNPNYSNPGYVTVDLLAGYSRKIGDATVSAQLNVNNLLDKRYATFQSVTPEINSAFVAFGSPRTFMGQISVQY
jgi:iron complex outermembrane recepter protein